MRFKKQKRHRKTLRFFTACFGFRDPFKVLCDGTFIHHLLVNGIMPADTALSNTLGAPVKIFTTGCVLAELKRLGEQYSESLKAARNLFTARCDHEKGISAVSCIKEIVGDDNHEHFFVASQDADLRKKFQEVPAVPVIYGLRNALFLEPPSAFQRQIAKSSEEGRSHMPKFEHKMLTRNQKIAPALEDPKKLPDVGGSEDDQNMGSKLMPKTSGGRIGPKVTGGVQFKRKKAKGPNPLSCKKKKDGSHVNLGSKKGSINGSEITGGPRSRKRKRQGGRGKQLVETSG